MGVTITKEEFLELPLKQQNALLFENTQEIKRIIGAYKTQQKIQWWSLGAIGAGLSSIFYMVYNHVTGGT